MRKLFKGMIKLNSKNFISFDEAIKLKPSDLESW